MFSTLCPAARTYRARKRTGTDAAQRSGDPEEDRRYLEMREPTIPVAHRRLIGNLEAERLENGEVQATAFLV
jgi:hypothetical protein